MYVKRNRNSKRAAGPIRSAAARSLATAAPGVTVCGTKNGLTSSPSKPAAVDSLTNVFSSSSLASRNVTFIRLRLASEELESRFVKESTAAGFDGLKGHRSVGGFRASCYNALPIESVQALIDCMNEFEKANV